MKSTDMKNSITLLFLFVLSFSSISANYLDNNPSAVDPNVKGYSFNLIAMKADKIEGMMGTEDYTFCGSVFLDTRKNFNSNFNKKEHFFFKDQILKDGDLFMIPGAHRSSKILKYNSISDYYVALKFGKDWSQYYYNDIMGVQFEKEGEELGLENCNIKREIYEGNHRVTLYIELKPIYYDESLVQIPTDEQEGKNG